MRCRLLPGMKVVYGLANIHEDMRRARRKRFGIGWDCRATLAIPWQRTGY